MSTWKIEDLVVKSGGESSASSIENRLKRGHAFYSYGPEPDGRWAVDPRNDWTIHQWATQLAEGTKRELETDYKEDDSQIPSDVKAYVESCANFKPEKGVRY
jgi:hypothetical protein